MNTLYRAACGCIFDPDKIEDKDLKGIVHDPSTVPWSDRAAILALHHEEQLIRKVVALIYEPERCDDQVPASSKIKRIRDLLNGECCGPKPMWEIPAIDELAESPKEEMEHLPSDWRQRVAESLGHRGHRDFLGLPLYTVADWLRRLDR